MYALDKYSSFGTEGSGNQKKFWVGDTLVKLNSKLYEADKEVSAYKIGRALGFDVVEYTKGSYIYKNKTYNGCQCKSFLNDGDEVITLYDCLIGVPIPNNLSAVEYFNIAVRQIVITTNNQITAEAASLYLKKLVLFDYIICNCDRHLTNIEIIINSNNCRFAPIYDNGQAFLCKNGIKSKAALETELRKFRTRPFSSNPEKNLIDIQFAKQYCSSIDLNNIKQLDINSFHKSLVLQRINKIIGG